MLLFSEIYTAFRGLGPLRKTAVRWSLRHRLSLPLNFLKTWLHVDSTKSLGYFKRSFRESSPTVNIQTTCNARGLKWQKFFRGRLAVVQNVAPQVCDHRSTCGRYEEQINANSDRVLRRRRRHLNLRSKEELAHALQLRLPHWLRCTGSCRTWTRPGRMTGTRSPARRYHPDSRRRGRSASEARCTFRWRTRTRTPGTCVRRSSARSRPIHRRSHRLHRIPSPSECNGHSSRWTASPVDNRLPPVCTSCHCFPVSCWRNRYKSTRRRRLGRDSRRPSSRRCCCHTGSYLYVKYQSSNNVQKQGNTWRWRDDSETRASHIALNG